MISRVLWKSKNFKFTRLFSNVVQPEVLRNEATEYPPIQDVSKKAVKIRKKLEIRDKIKSCPTIEEKIIQLNIPRYYGFKCIMLENNDFPYNSMPFIQYVTKTEFQELLDVTAIDEKESKKICGFLDIIKSDIQDAIEFEIDTYKNSFETDGFKNLSKQEIERAKTSRLIKQLNRVITNALGPDNRHLYESDIDVDPRIEAFWFVGNFVAPLSVQRFRKNKKWKDPEDEPVDRAFQYLGKPLLTIRHQYPLKPYEDIDFDLLTQQNKNIPGESVSSVDPIALGYHTFHRHGVTVPGFWPGNVREYGLLSYHDRTHLVKRSNVLNVKDHTDAIHSQGILSSFAWTYGQACYQGFSTYNDMNYPLTTQTVITDGQNWSFYKYQLNTTVTHTELHSPNLRYNKCYGTKEMKLYEHVDENGRIHGLNDDVLKQLISFYINKPESRNYEMKPYLDQKEKKIADIEDVNRRQWLEKIYKYLVSNRPRQYLTPEIYNWEHIYKIKFRTMPMDKKLRFFEYGINPFQRELSEHLPEYIPRVIRPGGIYDKKKRQATYYPLNHCSNDYKIMSNSEYGAAKEGIRRKYDRYRRTFK